MDLKDLIAKMDQIEQQPVQLNENTEQVNEVAPLVLVGLGMGLKWLWDKYQQSQDEADAAKKAAEDAKRAGDAAEAARLAAEALAKQKEAEEDKKRAQDAYNSKCKEKVGLANSLLSQLEDLLKAKVRPAAAPAPAAPAAAPGPTILGKIPLNEKCKTCGVEYKDHFVFDKDGKITAGKIKHPTFQGDFPGMPGIPRTGGSIANENFNIADSLVESFGYTLEKKDQVDEWSTQDTGDTIRGAFNGLTFGAGDNIQAGFKSAFGKNTYAQELEKERAETEKAQARSPSIKFSTPGLKIGDKEIWGKKDWNPSAYDAANLAGAVAVPIPGVGLAGAAAARGVKALAGTSKVAKGVAGTARVGSELGATYGALKGAEHVLDNHAISTLVANKGGDVRLGKAQAAMGFNDKELDGKMGPLTIAALEIVQQDNKLPVTKKLDDATAKVLGV